MDIANLNQLKVADLKLQLKARGLSLVGNKVDLIQRLEEALLSEASQSAKVSNVKEIDEEAILGGDDDSSLAKSDEALIHNEELLLSEPSIESSAIKNSTTPRINRSKLVVKASTETPKPSEATNQTSNETTSDTPNKTSIPASALSPEERKQLRMLKFADPKVVNRAQRFGTDLPKVEGIVELQKLKQRSERFGEVISTKAKTLDEKERLEKRKQRFGSAAATTPNQSSNGVNKAAMTDEAILKRQQRFGTVAQPETTGSKRRRFAY